MTAERAITVEASGSVAWRTAVGRVAIAWLALFVLTFTDWQEMVHQWWDIDTYSHILLIPPIIAWLVWIRRGELAKVEPADWWPGLIWLAAGLAIWLGGRALGVNLVAQIGVILALQGATIAIIGRAAGTLLAFPVFYALFLVPFGDEIIPPLQLITARIAVALTHWSGVSATVDGINIDTPAGLFIVAEACSGVKFLIAMIALGTLVSWTCFTSMRRRAWFMLACVVVPILANGVRAWATIFIAQYVGAEAAGGFDHIVYGWVFFAVVIALVLGVAWRWFEREPEEAGWSAADVAAMVDKPQRTASNRALVLVLIAVIAFAALARLV